MNSANTMKYVNDFWDESILPTLMEYIKIPNKSPHFDRHWQANGFMDEAVDLITGWCQKHALPNMKLEVIQAKDRTPLIFIEVEGNSEETVLLYGHLDKQPEMTGWDADLHPWKPVLRGDRLYGRGAADDGYAAFASLAAIKALKEQHALHARCVILIEASEESGSTDLPYYIDQLASRIGTPSLVICLDSGCGNYDQLWLTTSLRGLVSGILTVQVLSQGVHSGAASGVVPSSFRLLRQLLNRIEDEKSGDVRLKDLYVEIPAQRKVEASKAADTLEKDFFKEFPLLPGVLTESQSIPELILRKTWKPALSIIGCDGIPVIENAGNVTLPSLSFKLSMRLPPTSDATEAGKILKTILENDPPQHAKVHFQLADAASGWNAPKEALWLAKSATEASQEYFGKEVAHIGEGGSIPFMGMLGKKFPKAQFVITGVLGPQSNAHGPNEFLHLPTAKKVTACMAKMIADHFKK